MTPLEALRTGGRFLIKDVCRIRVSGSDAHRYLNGQLSIDTGRIVHGVARRACLLTAKGKLCAVPLVWSDGGAFVLEVPADMAEDVEQRIGRYVVADDVTVSVQEPAACEWHVFGKAAAEMEGRRCNRLGIPGVDVTVEPKAVPECPVEVQDIIRIIEGVPCWGRELDGDTLVQEAGLDDEAVDFDKGCYVGQEVVSRLRSVGRVNRRLAGFVTDDALPADGPLGLRTPDRGEAAGVLTSLGRDFELARTFALGYLHRNFEAAERFTVTNAAGGEVGTVRRQEFPLQ